LEERLVSWSFMSGARVEKWAGGKSGGECWLRTILGKEASCPRFALGLRSPTGESAVELMLETKGMRRVLYLNGGSREVTNTVSVYGNHI
jgi:hypothetical protein